MPNFGILLPKNELNYLFKYGSLFIEIFMIEYALSNILFGMDNGMSVSSNIISFSSSIAKNLLSSDTSICNESETLLMNDMFKIILIKNTKLQSTLNLQTVGCP